MSPFPSTLQLRPALWRASFSTPRVPYPGPAVIDFNSRAGRCSDRPAALRERAAGLSGSPLGRRSSLTSFFAPFGVPKESLRELGQAFETASPALMRQFAEGLKRQIVVGPKADWDMAREAVVERLLAAVQPHPEAGKPRLWAHGVKDLAVRHLPWPLPRAEDVTEIPEVPESGSDNIVRFGGAA